MYSRQPNLAHEPLGRGQADGAVRVGRLGRLRRLDRFQQTEVQRHGQQRVGHRPVLGEDGVLVRSEGVEATLDEVAPRRQRLLVRHGEPARPVDADRVEAPLVEVAAHCAVDVVLLGLPRRVDVERGRTLRRRLAVLVVVAPATADGRTVGLHQEVEALALGLVEVGHPEPGPVARPRREVLLRQRERRRGQDLGHHSVRLQALDEALGRPAGRLVHDDRAADLGQRLAVRVGGEVAHPVAELCRQMAHARQHEVQLLAVVAAGA